jgi:hypothetical protein
LVKYSLNSSITYCKKRKNKERNSKKASELEKYLLHGVAKREIPCPGRASLNHWQYCICNLEGSRSKYIEP